jgi:hypothetical protein
MQEKIDYLITPYNHMLNLKNSMIYIEDKESSLDSENSNSKRKSKPSKKFINKSNHLWSEIANFITNPKDETFKEKIGKNRPLIYSLHPADD